MSIDNEQLITALRSSLKENDRLQTHQRALELERSEPIAVVSMACRYPGAETPEQLWRIVDEGLDTTGTVPPWREWGLETLPADACATDRGGYLATADQFDAGFFNMSPREARATDPQHRLLLELAWELFERAGIPSSGVSESATGVYIGAAYQGYGQDWYEAPDALQSSLVAGMSTSIMSGRISYTLGLRGPAVTLDTACSSSLTALHLAVQGLRDGDCDLAVTGGAAVMAAPIALVGFSRQNGVAADGRCKAFGQAADGMGLGEGAGLVLLERVSRARAMGHPVLAVIRGTAANQDGASNGITAPNGPAQCDVIRRALAASGLEPRQIDGVECHGTGTRLGDPIEGNALVEVFGDRPTERPLWIGSLKSNIGHAQAAAGIAGVIKAVLSLQHRCLPRTLHCDPPSEFIDWTQGVRLLDHPVPIGRDGEPGRIGVSAFGLSGTNVHVVLEEAEAPPPRREAAPDDGRTRIWPLSARSRSSLRRQADRLAAWVSDHPEADLDDLAWTLATARSPLEFRAIVVGEDRDGLRSGLAAVAAGSPSPKVAEGRATPGGRSVCFVFPGQGSQFPGMARRMIASSPVFAAAIDACGAALAPHVDWELRELLDAEDASWQDDVTKVQPALWAIMVALARVWAEWGVTPSAVVGHSQGEIAAATVAGALTLEDGALVVARRSQALARIAGRGGMVAVRASSAAVLPFLAAAERLSLAVDNGPDSVVVSGDDAALADFQASAAAQGIDSRRVNVNYASHSPHVDELREHLAEALAPIRPQPGAVPFFSTVTAAVRPGEQLDAEYWFTNLRSQVRLGETIEALHAAGVARIVECSPHPVLVPSLDHLEDGSDRWFLGESLRRDQDGYSDLIRSAARLHCTGFPLRWELLLQPAGIVSELPTYAFDRNGYWLASRSTPHAEAEGLAYRVSWPEVGVPVGVPACRVAVVSSAGCPAAWRTILREVFPDAVPIEVGSRAEAAALRAQLRESGVDVVLSLLALDETAAGTAGRTVGLTATLALIQAAGALRVPCWHLTVGAVAVAAGESPTPAQAAVWGLVRVGLVERPGSGGLLDLVDPPTAASAGILRAVISGGMGEETQVVVRDGRVGVRRLERAPESTESWRTSRPAVVFGGTAGIGAGIAGWLAERGARELALASRTGVTPEALKLADRLREQGCTVSIHACDVTDPAAVRRVLDAVPGVGTVISTVGALDDALVDDLTPARLDTVLAAKMAGNTAIAEASVDLDLDALVLFSSLAGVLGGPGQANYAAANAAVDALATALRAQGRPAMSIAWGAVAGGGLASNDTLARLSRQGLPPLSLAEACTALGRAMVSGQASVVLARVRWAQLASDPDRVVPAIRDLIGPAPDPVIAERLAGNDQRWTLDSLEVFVREQIAAVLSYAEPSELDERRPLRELGFDSVTIVDLRRRLAAATGLRLPVTVMFDHPTIRELCRHLATELGLSAEPAAEPLPTLVGVPADDAIAVVGLGCRLPGGIETPGQMWNMMVEGRDLVGGFPTDRGWDLDRFNADAAVPGTFYATGGAFLDRPADFDAGFFGISPREAASIDPQHRLLLEVAWAALQDADLPPEELRGTATGVFVGASYNDYASRLATAPPDLEGYLALGSASSVASGRIAYTLGLQGPAITVDTACSSSLVALTLACQSLGDATCELALVGGVTVMSTMETFIEFSRQRAMSQDGRCKAFSNAADGAGWAEGVGVVVLERLSEARRKGHRVLCTIAGIAMNQDGASNGLTAPSGTAQQKVIRAALARAGLDPAAVDAIEAHGTGTELGDPIEAGALAAVYGQTVGAGSAERGHPLWLGSLKSNIGHTQAASGILGLIKLALCLEHGVLPRTLHAEVPSRHIDWEGGPLELLQEPVAWPKGERRRIAGLSAFGISGTNVHVLIADPADETEPTEVPTAPVAAPWPVPLVVSARSEASLRLRAAQLREEVAEDLPGLAAALLRHREEPFWAVVAATTADATTDALDALAEGRPSPDVKEAWRKPGGDTAWVFGGQGTQRPGMAADLYDRVPAFQEALDEVLAELEPLLDFSLRDAMFTGAGIDRTAAAQPAIFAEEVALARCLLRAGLTPDVVCGHSIGEFAAAQVAGIISLADACRLVAARGQLMQSLPEGGVMVSARAGADQVLPLLDDLEDVALAAVNGPQSVVVSGARPAVSRVVDALGAAGVRTRALTVSHAFHSPLMAPMLDEFEAVTRTIEHGAPRLPMISTVTGERLNRVTAEYWVRHVSATVQFSAAVAELRRTGVGTFVEIGPAAVLASQIPLTLGEEEALVVPLQVDGRPQAVSLVDALAALDSTGRRVDWQAWLGEVSTAHRVLPPYPFDHKRYWLDASRATGDVTSAGQAGVEGRLLGARIDLPDGGVVYTSLLSRAALPWLDQHCIGDRPILPGTALLELALEAGMDLGLDVVEELAMVAPLAISADPSPLRVTARPAPGGTMSLEIAALLEGSWQVNATGRLAGTVAPAGQDSNLPETHTGIDTASLYEALDRGGFAYGPAFQGLAGAGGASDGAIIATARLQAAAGDSERYVLHPALLDSALHALAFVDLPALSGSFIPFSWSDVRCAPAGDELRVLIRPSGPDRVQLDLFGEDGSFLGSIGRLVLRPAAELVAHRSESLHEIAWVDTRAGTAPGRVWVLGTDDDAQLLGLPGAETATTMHEVPPECDVAVTLFDVPDTGEVAGDALAGACRALELAQALLCTDHRAVLCIVTRNATADSPSPAAAAAWGLVGSAINENPGRLRLIDVLGDDFTALGAALGTADEPRLRTCGSVVQAQRISVLRPERVADHGSRHGTVLVTGASGTLGRAVAAHLATREEVTALVLMSRRGGSAPELADLAAELTALGTPTVCVAGDVAEIGDVEVAVASVPAGRPLVGVVHAAGVLDDGVVTQLTPGRLTEVIRTKVGGAEALWRATAGLGLESFVLFSSVAGILGGAGQGSYAAANTALDAYARTLAMQGHPVVSLPWGLWAARSTMTDSMSSAGMERADTAGIAEMTMPIALDLYDRAVAQGRPVVVTAVFAPEQLEARAQDGTLLSAFRGLVRPRVVTAPVFGDQLATVPVARRLEVVRDRVRRIAAEVLGFTSHAQVPVEAGLLDAGFDSLTAIEFRNRLAKLTGLRLPATLLFDFGTVAAIAEQLLAELEIPEPAPAPEAAAPAALDVHIDALVHWLDEAPDSSDQELVESLTRLRDRLDRRLVGTESDETFFALIDAQLGSTALQPRPPADA